MVRNAGDPESALERRGGAGGDSIAAASMGAYGRNASLRRVACPGAPAGWIAYRALGPVVVALGDPRLAPAAGPWRSWVVWYGAPPTLAPARSRRPLGPEAIVRPDRFTLCGRRMARLRSALHVAEREGIEVVETTWPALRDDHRRQARDADRAWRRRHPVRYGFTLSTFEDAIADDRPWFLAFRKDRVEAFVTWLWSSDERGWVLDLMRRVDGGGHGAMDLLVVRGIEAAAARRLDWVSLGVGVEGTGVRAFKEKFRPEWQDRWIVLPGGAARRAIGLTAVAAAHVLPARTGQRPIRHRHAARGRRPIARWSLAVASALMLLTFAVPQVHAVGAARAEGVVDELRASPVAARALAAWDHRPRVPGKMPPRPGGRAAVLA